MSSDAFLILFMICCNFRNRFCKTCDSLDLGRNNDLGCFSVCCFCKCL